jgi:hypothetical protein
VTYIYKGVSLHAGKLAKGGWHVPSRHGSLVRLVGVLLGDGLDMGADHVAAIVISVGDAVEVADCEMGCDGFTRWEIEKEKVDMIWMASLRALQMEPSILSGLGLGSMLRPRGSEKCLPIMRPRMTRQCRLGVSWEVRRACVSRLV